MSCALSLSAPPVTNSILSAAEFVKPPPAPIPIPVLPEPPSPGASINGAYIQLVDNIGSLLKLLPAWKSLCVTLVAPWSILPGNSTVGLVAPLAVKIVPPCTVLSVSVLPESDNTMLSADPPTANVLACSPPVGDLLAILSFAEPLLICVVAYTPS